MAEEEEEEDQVRGQSSPGSYRTHPSAIQPSRAQHPHLGGAEDIRLVRVQTWLAG